jgi:hypothetical protein
MIYSMDNWVICINSLFEDEYKRFLILSDEHYGESSILLFRTVYAFLIESQWISMATVYL